MPYHHATVRTINHGFVRHSLASGLLMTTLLGLVATQSQAARPMLTDDATLAEGCQIETWIARSRADQETIYNVAPACTLAGIEWSFGMEIPADRDDIRYQFAAKTEFLSLDRHDIGVTLQAEYDALKEHLNDGDWHLNLAITQGFQDELWLLHINTGLLKGHKESVDWTGGLAIQRSVGKHRWMFTEVYRADSDRPLYQVGYLQEIIPERVQLDVSYGNRISNQHNDGLVTAGLVYYF